MHHFSQPTQALRSMPPSSDILSSVVRAGVFDVDDPEAWSSLCALSLTCKSLRKATLPLLFASVKWPHQNRVDMEFFPKTVWEHIRSFSLEWPDEWSWPPETPETPPHRGIYYLRESADYDAGPDIEKLLESLPKISGIQAFCLDCPFFPPYRLLKAIFQFPNLHSLVMRDTPFYMTPIWLEEWCCPKLERVSLCPVKEALRVGNEATHPSWQDPRWEQYPHRQKYASNISFAKHATENMLSQADFTRNLSQLEVSTGLCDFQTLRRYPWPKLRTLIISGAVPAYPLNKYDSWKGHVLDLVDVMPSLVDLRLLLSQEDGRATGIRRLPIAKISNKEPSSGSSPEALLKLGRLRSFSASLAVDLVGALEYMTSLQSLSILAISQHPTMPTAVSEARAIDLLGDDKLTKMGKGLKRLRMIVEDGPSPDFCGILARRFPGLEHLELERREYSDGQSEFDCTQFTDALSSLTTLASLRLALRFPHPSNSPQNPRDQCGIHFATTLPSLVRVGFEYRTEDGHDGWRDWDVGRYRRWKWESEAVVQLMRCPSKEDNRWLGAER